MPVPLSVVELKAFVPAKDYALSQRFYQDLGFTLASDGGGIAYFHYGPTSFLLQDFYQPGHASHFMMHLLVEDAQAWHTHVEQLGVVQRYGVRLTSPVLQPWGMLDFTLTDPSGVLWRIAQNVPPHPHQTTSP